MTIDRDVLKAAAEAASPGEWRTLPINDESLEIHIQADEGLIARVWGGMHHLPEEDAAYIALANPQTMLALLAELERLREALDRKADLAGKCLLCDEAVTRTGCRCELCMAGLGGEHYTTRRKVRVNHKPTCALAEPTE